MPNSKLTGDNIINFTANDTRLVAIPLSIGYPEDVAKVRQVLLALAKDDPRVLKDPAPAVVVKELLDDKVIVVLNIWTKTADYGNVLVESNEKIKKRFDVDNIQRPRPTRWVQMLENKPHPPPVTAA